MRDRQSQERPFRNSAVLNFDQNAEGAKLRAEYIVENFDVAQEARQLTQFVSAIVESQLDQEPTIGVRQFLVDMRNRFVNVLTANPNLPVAGIFQKEVNFVEDGKFSVSLFEQSLVQLVTVLNERFGPHERRMVVGSFLLFVELTLKRLEREN